MHGLIETPLTHPRRTGRKRPPAKPVAFATDDALLAAAHRMFQARDACREAENESTRSPKLGRELRRLERAWTDFWHRSVGMTGGRSVIFQRCPARLSRLEREVVIVLVMLQLGLIRQHQNEVSDLLGVLGVESDNLLAAIRVFGDNGRLVRAGLINFADPDADPANRQPVIDPLLIEDLTAGKSNKRQREKVRTETELLEKIKRAARFMARKVAMLRMPAGLSRNADAYRCMRKIDRMVDEVNATLAQQPTWKLNQLRSEVVTHREWVVCLVLLCRELGCDGSDEELFHGSGLARAVARSEDEITLNLRLVRPDGRLVRKGIIRPCGGMASMATDDPRALEKTEFELSEKTLATLDLKSEQITGGSCDFPVHEPRIRLDQIVLPEKLGQSLRLALVQARHGQRIMSDWGLQEKLAYGRGTILLFSGPPGSGKTCTAEALAHELGRGILVADYSRLQNCFVGETEKRIARIFREASRRNAVLLWDEADAMFTDREAAHQAWEVRHVNVLLQEIERFEGLCILATNRKIVLDKALQRRISLKLDFPRPGAAERRQIWRALLPEKMPLAPDVDMERLSRVELMGGEIKNVVLNAARLAVQRNEAGPVTMGDFSEAIQLECSGKWSGQSKVAIGFASGKEQ